MEYFNITDPINGDSVKTNSILGRKILNNYIVQLLGGSNIRKFVGKYKFELLPENPEEQTQIECGTQWGVGRNKDFSKCIANEGVKSQRACKLRWFINESMKSNECTHIYMLMCKIHSVLIIKHRTNEQLPDDPSTANLIPFFWTLVELGSNPKSLRSTIMSMELTGDFNILRSDIANILLTDAEILLKIMGTEKSPYEDFQIEEYNTKCGAKDLRTKMSKTASRGRKCILKWRVMKQKDIRDKFWTLEQIWGMCNQFLKVHPRYSPVCLFNTANCQAFTAKIWGYITGNLTLEPVRKYSKLYKLGGALKVVSPHYTAHNFIDANIFQRPIFDSSSWFYETLTTLISNLFNDSDAWCDDAKNAYDAFRCIVLGEDLDDDPDHQEVSAWWLNFFKTCEDDLHDKYTSVKDNYPNLFRLNEEPIRIDYTPDVLDGIQNILTGFEYETMSMLQERLISLFNLINSQNSGTNHINLKSKLLDHILIRAKSTGNTPIIGLGVGQLPAIIFNPLILDNILCNDIKYDIYIIDRWSQSPTPWSSCLSSGELWCFKEHLQAFNSNNIPTFTENLDSKFCSIMERGVKLLIESGLISMTNQVGELCSPNVTDQIKKNISIIPIETDFNKHIAIPYLAQNIGSDKQLFYHDGTAEGGLLISDPRMGLKDYNYLKKVELIKANPNLIILGLDGLLGGVIDNESYVQGVKIMNQCFNSVDIL